MIDFKEEFKVKWLKKKENKGTLEDNNDKKCNANTNDNEEDAGEVEWVWVDGFKGTDSNMKCREYQYELGKKFVHENDTEMCESGFHFCIRLKDINNHYELLTKGNRFFKVKGLVRKVDLDRYCLNEKLVAKEIEFIEEIPKEECFEVYKEINTYDYLETMEDYIIFMNLSENEQVKYLECIMKKKFMDVGYSETFSLLLAKRISYVESFPRYMAGYPEPHTVYGERITKSIDDRLYLKAKALKESGVSADMCAYLLLN